MRSGGREEGQVAGSMERRAAIALRGKQPPIECENLIQVIFIAAAKESVISPQRKLSLNKYFLRYEFSPKRE